MAMGSETVSSFIASRAGARPGKAFPKAIPNAMARKIHTGSQRSRVESCPATARRLRAVVAVACVMGFQSPLLLWNVAHGAHRAGDYPRRQADKAERLAE